MKNFALGNLPRVSSLLSVGRGPRRYTNILFLLLFRILLAAAASRGGMRDYFLFSIKNFAGGGGLQTFFSLGASR